ncbi:MAG: hypothetical protein J7K38_03060 [Thermoplasmata archaeon]|nr:hypothetical protein [Thermoplasmata archaeon]
MNIYELFEDLKHALYLPEDTQLKYLPGKGGKYRGMVSRDGKTIFIFDEDEEEAKRTLIHECIELLIVNLAKVIVNPNKSPEELLMMKEVVVDTLTSLISEKALATRGNINWFVRELKKAGGR